MSRSSLEIHCGQIGNIIGDIIIVLHTYVLRIKLPLRVADCARVQQQKAWPELVRLPFILASELAAATNIFVRTFVSLVRL